MDPRRIAQHVAAHSNPEPDYEAWLTLHSALYEGVSADLLLSVCSKSDFSGTRVAINDPAAAWAYAKRHNFRDVYFRIAPMTPRDYGRHERGGKADSALITCLWADIDLAGGVHAKEDLPTVDEAARIIRSILAPSIIIDSGGGRHCYWILDQHIDPNSIQGKDLLKRFAALWKTQFALRGYSVDAGVSSNCATVLRMPGTLNAKGDTMKPVRVTVSSPETSYSESDVLSVAPESPRVENRVTKTARRIAGRTIVTNTHGVLDMDEMLAAVFGLEPAGSGRWIHPHADGTISPYDTHAQVFDCEDGVRRVTAFGDRLQALWLQDDISHSLSCFDLVVIACGHDVDVAKTLLDGHARNAGLLYSALASIHNHKRGAA